MVASGKHSCRKQKLRSQMVRRKQKEGAGSVCARMCTNMGLRGRGWSEENGSEFDPGVGSAEVGGHHVFTLIWLEPV